MKGKHYEKESFKLNGNCGDGICNDARDKCFG